MVMMQKNYDKARKVVRCPAFGIQITGFFAVCGQLAVIAYRFVQYEQLKYQVGFDGTYANLGLDIGFVLELLLNFGILLSSCVVFTAGGRMSTLEGSTNFIYAGIIMAMVPFCVNLFFIIGFPFGIWALFAMQHPDVQRALSSQASRPPKYVV
jgi:nitric oxide reductase large subunit